VRRAPGQIDQLFLDAGQTGLTVGARVLDNEGQTTIARTTGFVEFPAGTGLYYLDDFEFPDTRGSYTILYDWDGGTAAPGFTATEDLEITSSEGEPFVGDTYADTDELARILKIRTPSAEQTLALERVLIAATHEIDEEIDREDDDPVSGAEISLAAQVCLQRATELWMLQEVPLGVAGIGSEMGASYLARNSWEKYAFTLAPLKRQWGFA
jgi:hypothetical protein